MAKKDLKRNKAPPKKDPKSPKEGKESLHIANPLFFTVKSSIIKHKGKK